ncbi:MAG: matrixin family metalloprotease [Verrucomicrobiaceae bacterium]|nr:MAG: matrixin family metalloprotease [Verrucomicrobiaceae bacterium]
MKRSGHHLALALALAVGVGVWFGHVDTRGQRVPDSTDPRSSARTAISSSASSQETALPASSEDASQGNGSHAAFAAMTPQASAGNLLLPRDSQRQKGLSEIAWGMEPFVSLPEELQSNLAQYAASLALDPVPGFYCWSEGTDPRLVEAYARVEQQILGKGDSKLQALQVGYHWNRTALDGANQNVQGLPVRLTWSIIPDGTAIQGDGNTPSNLRARLAAIYGGNVNGPAASQPWYPIIKAAFDHVASACGVRFVYEAADDGTALNSLDFGFNGGIVGTRGDIRIGGHRIDGNNGTVARAYYPDVGDIIIDTEDDYFATTSNNSVRLRNAVEHELGHALGLMHSCPLNGTKLMEPQLSTNFTGSQFDEIYSLQRNYGDPLEVSSSATNNDTAAAAQVLGSLPSGSSRWKWLSIDDNSDTDYYRFTTPSEGSLTVRVIPSDPAIPSYLEGPQSSNGSCTAGTLFYPAVQQDLILELLSGDGTTVLATANSQPAGGSEELIGLPRPSTANFFIRIRGGTNDRAQLYELEISRSSASPVTVGVTLGNLESVYDGNPKPVTVITNPSGVSVTVNYGSASNPPTKPGQYTVSAAVAEAGFQGNASGVLVIQSAYTKWISTFANPESPSSAPSGDLDGDGWDNLAEYAFATDPRNGGSLPTPQLEMFPAVLRLKKPNASSPGITIRGEVSTGLQGWTSEGVTETPEGFEVPRASGRTFMRLIYSLDES